MMVTRNGLKSNFYWLGHISISLPVHEHGGVLGLDGVHYLLAEEVVYLGVPVNLLVVAESVTEYLSIDSGEFIFGWFGFWFNFAKKELF